MSNSQSALQIICEANGLKLEDVQSGNSASKVEALEIFLTPLERIVGFETFTNLKRLEILKQSIKTIEGLDRCPLLEQLWLTGNEISRIQGLTNCRKLRELYLSENRISQLENLTTLSELQVLDVSDNCLHQLSGVSALRNLRRLNVAGNKISTVKTHLDSLSALRELNLSDNAIVSFDELHNIARLKHVSSVSFTDQDFGPNPVCRLLNYQTVVRGLFQHVTQLDSVTLSPDMIQEAQAVLRAKQMFAWQQQREVNRASQVLIEQFQHQCQTQLASMVRLMQPLLQTMGVLDQADEPPADSCASSLINQLLTAAVAQPLSSLLIEQTKQLGHSQSIAARNVLRKAYEAHIDEPLLGLVGSVGSARSRWHQELQRENVYRQWEHHSAGNIRVEPLPAHSPQFTTCVDFLRKRGLSSDVLGVKGQPACNVWRLHSELCNQQFEDALDLVPAFDPMNFSENDLSKEESNRAFDYLFYALPAAATEATSMHETAGSEHQLKRILEFGFPVASTDKPIILSSTLSQSSVQASTRVVVVRAYLGACVAAKDVSAVQQAAQRKKSSVSDQSSTSGELPCDSGAGVLVWSSFENEAVPAPTASGTAKPAREKHRKFRIYDTKYLVPEYLIELSASTTFADVSGASSSVKAALTSSCKSSQGQACSSALDQAVISLPALISAVEHGMTKAITQVNSDQRTCAAPLLKAASAPAVGLKVSDHTISSVLLDQQTLLDSDMDREVSPAAWLQRHAFVDLSTVRDAFTVFGSREVTSGDLARADWTIAQLLSARHQGSDTDSARVWSTDQLYTLVNRIVISNQQTKALPIEHILELLTPERFPNLRSLTIEHQQLTNVSSIAKLELVELNLAHNKISERDIPVLASMPTLEALDLSFNHLRSWPTAQGFSVLKKLCLDGNSITSLTAFSTLPNLVCLYLANNQITSMKQLLSFKESAFLSVLDLRCNPLNSESYRKSSEPSSDAAERLAYRSFTIHHLPQLRMLDGTIISLHETQQAFEMFNGKLSEDDLSQIVGHTPTSLIEKLDLSNRELRNIQIISAKRFPRLVELILDDNLIESTSALPSLPNLICLRLNGNRIDDFGSFVKSDAAGSRISSSRPSLKDLFPRLQVLELGRCGITSIPALGLRDFPSLRVLSLENNRITSISGLEGLPNLQHLLLSRNRLKRVDVTAFTTCTNLRGLQLEHNGLRTLVNIGPLPKLRGLFLAGNRVVDLAELDFIAGDKLQGQVTEVTLKGNPISRKPLCRLAIIRKLQYLRVLDGTDVSPAEREQSELYALGGAFGNVLYASPMGGDMGFDKFSGSTGAGGAMMGSVPFTSGALPFAGSNTMAAGSTASNGAVGMVDSSLPPWAQQVCRVALKVQSFPLTGLPSSAAAGSGSPMPVHMINNMPSSSDQKAPAGGFRGNTNQINIVTNVRSPPVASSPLSSHLPASAGGSVDFSSAVVLRPSGYELSAAPDAAPTGVPHHPTQSVSLVKPAAGYAPAVKARPSMGPFASTVAAMHPAGSPPGGAATVSMPTGFMRVGTLGMSTLSGAHKPAAGPARR